MSEGLEQTDIDIDLFELEPLVLRRLHDARLRRSRRDEVGSAQTRSDPIRLRWVLLGTAACVVVPLVLAASLSGKVAIAGGFDAVGGLGRDLRVWAGFSDPQVGPNGELDAYASFPLVRDYSALLIALSTIIAYPCVFAIFRIGRGLHHELWMNGALEFDDDDAEQQWREASLELQHRLEQVGSRWYRTMLGSLGVAVVFYLIASGYGGVFDGSFFGNFVERRPENDRDIDEWVAAARSSWWASPWSFGSVVWVVLGTVGVYIVVVQTIAGLAYRNFLSTVHDVGRFRPAPANIDGHFGFQPFRRLVLLCFVSLITSAATGFGLLAMFRSSAVGAGIALAVFVMLAVCVVYVIFGLTSSVRAGVRDFKRTEIRRLTDLFPSIHRGMTSDQMDLVETLRRETKYVSDIPSIPFVARPAAAIALLASGVGVVVAVVNLVKEFT